jgi:threonine dehydrogenase-like Zn-dependent dehydrogenase
MGHEPCGTVAALGPGVTGFEIGDRVMIHHCEGCDVCDYCRQGYYQLCVHGARTYGGGSDGAHADYLLARVSTLVPLPDQLSFEEGATLSCGTGTAYFALRRLQIADGETLAVYGQGPVGLSATLLAKHMGARVIAVDISASRLQLARGLGADVVVNSDAHDPIAAIHELTGGRGADASVDCTGVAIARQQAVRSVRVFGRSCLVGEGGTVTFDATPDIIHRQLALYGSWTFPAHGLAESSRFAVDHRIPLHKLITHRFPLEQAEEAYQKFDAGLTGKCVLVLDDRPKQL